MYISWVYNRIIHTMTWLRVRHHTSDMQMMVDKICCTILREGKLSCRMQVLALSLAIYLNIILNRCLNIWIRSSFVFKDSWRLYVVFSLSKYCKKLANVVEHSLHVCYGLVWTTLANFCLLALIWVNCANWGSTTQETQRKVL